MCGIDECCCKCKNHWPMFSHPCTDGKPMNEKRGWACVVMGRVFPDWPEHSVGCELFDNAQVVKLADTQG